MARFVPDSTEQAEGREMEDGKWLTTFAKVY
jgi:hypothetical protein